MAIGGVHAQWSNNNNNELLLGAIPMVTMAQSAANWRNTHTHVDRTHSGTHTLYINTVTTTWCSALTLCVYGAFIMKHTSVSRTGFLSQSHWLFWDSIPAWITAVPCRRDALLGRVAGRLAIKMSGFPSPRPRQYLFITISIAVSLWELCPVMGQDSPGERRRPKRWRTARPANQPLMGS